MDNVDKVNPKIVRSPICRISYPWVFKMQEFKDGKKSYNLVMLIPKSEGATKANKDPVMRKMYAALKAAAVEKWGNGIPQPLKFPIKDGDKETDKEGKPKAECAGMWVVAASSRHKPGIVGPDAETYLESEAEFYAGCFAHVSINGFTWTSEYNKSGVSFGLRNVQKVKDGPKLGGIVAAHDDFEPVAGSDAPDLEGEEEADDGF